LKHLSFTDSRFGSLHTLNILFSPTVNRYVDSSLMAAVVIGPLDADVFRVGSSKLIDFEEIISPVLLSFITFLRVG
jgi:hypothetical protein